MAWVDYMTSKFAVNHGLFSGQFCVKTGHGVKINKLFEYIMYTAIHYIDHFQSAF